MVLFFFPVEFMLNLQINFRSITFFIFCVFLRLQTQLSSTIYFLFNFCQLCYTVFSTESCIIFFHFFSSHPSLTPLPFGNHQFVLGIFESVFAFLLTFEQYGGRG